MRVFIVYIHGIKVGSERIGVMTTDFWFTQCNGHVIYICNDLCCFHRGKECIDQNIEFKLWKNDDIIRINLNFDKLEVTFFVNDDISLPPQNLQHNKTYYIVINIQDLNGNIHCFSNHEKHSNMYSPYM